jgi:tRNA(fMet)-specific endonuclease VapC
MYLLDSNACIEFLRGKNAVFLRNFVSHPASDLFVCSIVAAELRYGAARSRHPGRERAKVDLFLTLYTSFDFDDVAASLFVERRVDLETRGVMIGEFDLMIAAIALTNNLTLVTHNTAEFGRVTGLTLEDWELP